MNVSLIQVNASSSLCFPHSFLKFFRIFVCWRWKSIPMCLVNCWRHNKIKLFDINLYLNVRVEQLSRISQQQLIVKSIRTASFVKWNWIQSPSLNVCKLRPCFYNQINIVPYKEIKSSCYKMNIHRFYSLYCTSQILKDKAECVLVLQRCAYLEANVYSFTTLNGCNLEVKA